MPARGSTRPRRRPADRLRVESLTDRTVPAASLLLATDGDHSGGTPGLGSWTAGTIVGLGDPNFGLEPGGTTGTFSALASLDAFGDGNVGISALHYVRRPVTVGTGAASLALLPGDLLLSTAADETFTSLNTLSVRKDEVFVFRPAAAGDYSSGTFLMLLDDFGAIHGGGETWSVALVETDTLVGDRLLPAGSILFSRQGGSEHNDVRLFTPTGVGPGTTAGSVAVLIEGDDLGYSARVYGLELVEATTTVGGRTLPAGTLLLSLESDENSVGANGLAVRRQDVFALAVTQTTLSGGQAVATASLVFTGAAVGLDNERLHGVALLAPPPAAPVAGADGYSTPGNTTLTVPASAGVLANDSDPNGDPLTARLVTGPTHGTLMLHPTGAFAYAPAPGYLGPDSFTYEVDDGQGGTDTGVVRLLVTTNRLVVDTAADTADGDTSSIMALLADTGADGLVSLREALLAANNTPNTAAGPDRIVFAIPGGGPFVIRLAADLPHVTDGVVVDGPTQPGFAGTPLIELDGSAAGPGSHGLQLAASSSGTTIRGLIVRGFGGPGILVDGPTGVLIGGTQPDEGNVITGNGGGGVVVQAGSARIVRNDIDGNGGLGIDLNGDGVTPNDNDDPDVGPNGLQNYPDLTGAVVTGGTLTVTGSLKSSRGATFVVDFYGSPAAAASGHGEGAVYLGSTSVTLTTNGGGNRSFAVGLSTTVPAGWVVTATATDAGGNTSEFSAAVPVDGTPVAADDSYAAFEDQTLAVPAASGLLANDTDPGGGPLTATLLAAPARGTVTVNPDGSFDYTPAANFYGTETFTYTVRDADGLTDVGTVTIDVAPVNDPPTFTIPNNPPAVNEDAGPQTVTGFATELSVGPDSGGGSGTPQTLAFVVTGNTNPGLFAAGPAISPDGTLTYTPAADAFGTATVTVVAQDSGGTANGGQDTSAPWSFGITVRSVNDPPTFDPVPDQTVTEDPGPQSVQLTGISAGPNESQPIRVTAVSSSPALIPNPTVTYTSPAATGSLDYQPAANASGSAVITVTVREPGTDGVFGTADDLAVSRQFRITVTPANDPPAANPDAYAAVGAVTVPALAGVLTNDTDIDGDPLAAVLVTPPANGTVTLNPDGSFTYTASPLYAGPDAFTYQARDPSGALSPVTTVTINVSLPNRPPIASDDTATATEDTPLNGPSVLANDTDPDGDSMTAQLVSGPAHGTLSLRADGTFTYTPAPNYHGSDSFTYRASDGRLTSAPATVRIIVAPVNDAPTAANDLYSTEQNRPLTVTTLGVLDNDADVDGDPLTAQIESGPANGTLTLNADGSFTYTPLAGFRGTDTFTYRVTDPGGASAAATVTLRVVPPSGRPVAQNDGYTLTEDGSLSVPAPGVLANDTPPGFLPLYARLVSGPRYGTLTFNPDGSFTYTPDPDFSGTDSFTYRAVDINGGTSSAVRVTLTVTPTADPPAGVADQFVATQDTPLTVAAPGVVANDSDPDGDRLTAVLVGRPGNGTLTLNPDGSFTYTPNAGFSGNDSFTYTLTDGQFTSSPIPVTITVRSVVPPPDPKPRPTRPEPAPPRPPVVPPPSGSPAPTPEPGEPPPAGGGGAPIGSPILPVPPVIGTGPPAFGGPGLSDYLTSAPAGPALARGDVPAPNLVLPSLPSLPPAPSVPVVPPPIRVDTRPTPVLTVPPVVVPDVPAVPAVPQLQADNPVFGGLDNLAKDVGQGKKVEAVTGTVVGTGVVATAGYVLLSPRLAYWFLSALLARRTVWKPFDPVEVLYAWERDKGSDAEGDDDSLKSMLDSPTDRPA